MELTFGKHKNRTFEWVAANDASYCRWAVTNFANHAPGTNQRAFYNWLQTRSTQIVSPQQDLAVLIATAATELALQVPQNHAKQISWAMLDPATRLYDGDTIVQTTVDSKIKPGFTTFMFFTELRMWWKQIRILGNAGNELLKMESKRGSMVVADVATPLLYGATVEFWKAKFLGQGVHMYTMDYPYDALQGFDVRIAWKAE